MRNQEKESLGGTSISKIQNASTKTTRISQWWSFFKRKPFDRYPFLDLRNIMFIIRFMSSDFDWFMITMPVFALVVFAIVMVGSMEKQPKFLEVPKTKKALLWGFGGMFGVGIVVSLYYMLLRFVELLGNYWNPCPFTSSLAAHARRTPKFWSVRWLGKNTPNAQNAGPRNSKKTCRYFPLPPRTVQADPCLSYRPVRECPAIAGDAFWIKCLS